MKVNRFALVFFVLAAGALIYAYTALLARKHAEDALQDTQRINAAAAKESGYVTCNATVVSVDPLKGDALIRLELAPQGELLADDGVSPTRTLDLNTNSSTGKAENTYKKGEAMSPTDVTLRLHEGSINDYPNDQYVLHLELIMSTVDPAAENGFSSAPIRIDWKPEAPGYTITCTQVPLGKDEAGRLDLVNLDMHVRRSFTTRVFALFLLSLIWMLALCAAMVVISVCVFGRKVELNFFQWFATLLFALLPLRNGLPGAPPIGSLPDYTTFFWAEAVIALSLVSVVCTWLYRKT